ncbi:MAG: efflux RND transporter periplasmic adaptor subunit [Gammaproteobacteria bacterium]
MSIGTVISKRPWLLAVAVAAVVMAWLASGYLGERKPPELMPGSTSIGDAESVPRVQIVSQVAKPVTRMISVYGQTAPARTVEMSSETEGRVEAVEAIRGRRVRAGEVILRLDMRDRRARMAQADAAVREARTSYEAQLKLQQDGYVSETQIAESVAKLESAKAELTRANLDLEYMVVRAPFDGVLQERDVEIGDFVRSGDKIATFVDNTSIIVTGTIAEQDARFVHLDDDGQAKLATGQEVAGRIRYISPVADESTRTFNVELEVANPDGSLPAGVTAEMNLPGGKTLAHKVSPSLLTLNSAGDIGVKVIDAYDRVEFYPVVLSMSEQDGVWVSGLPETAKIITVGQGYVKTGQAVDPVFAQPDTALAESESQGTAEQVR